MAAATLDLALEQGATFRRTLTWKTGTTPVLVNLTGYTARMMLKATPVRNASRIVAISKASPGVVTTQEAHKLKTGQSVVLPGVGGMIELTSRYTITVITDTTFSIGVNTTAYTTYTSGGTVAFASITTTANNDGSITLGGALGTIDLYIKDTTTDVLTVGGVYDLEMIAGSTDVTRLVQGKYSLSLNVTT